MTAAAMAQAPPVIWWVRRDLRLADNLALDRAAAAGRPVIPVFIADAALDALGAAPRFRLGLGLAALQAALEAKGSRLILRRGEAGAVLLALAAQTGARDVVWNRLYDVPSRDRDAAVKRALPEAGIAVQSFAGHLLHEPWEVATGQGGFYKVFTPFWRSVSARDVPAPLPAPPRLPAPAVWPASDRLEDWQLSAAMRRGAPVVAAHQHPGEAAAFAKMEHFLATRLAAYPAARDRLDEAGTSGLSEHLAWGEIGPRSIWHASLRAEGAGGAEATGGEAFRRELVWRDFAWHLLHHTPRIATGNWKPEWDHFPWRADNADAEAWRQGRTGCAVVDAAMREMYVTGRMHNRARMLVASYLTKHLLTHWRVGLDWFAECLTDWDPASNAMGWQWAAGSGPDAAPYFRIFNPETQAARFDPQGRYRRRFVAELSPGGRGAGPEALAFFEAAPRRWGLSPAMTPARPLVDLAEGRARALAAYSARPAAQDTGTAARAGRKPLVRAGKS